MPWCLLQEDEGDTQPKPKSPPETKPCTPPPVTVSAIAQEDDEGDKIMAELQVSDVYRCAHTYA